LDFAGLLFQCRVPVADEKFAKFNNFAAKYLIGGLRKTGPELGGERRISRQLDGTRCNCFGWNISEGTTKIGNGISGRGFYVCFWGSTLETVAGNRY